MNADKVWNPIVNAFDSKTNLKFSIANILSDNFSFSNVTDGSCTLLNGTSTNSKKSDAFQIENAKNGTNDANIVSIGKSLAGENDGGNLPISNSVCTGTRHTDIEYIIDSCCASNILSVSGNRCAGINDAGNAEIRGSRRAEMNDAFNVPIIDNRCVDNEPISDSCRAKTNDSHNAPICDCCYANTHAAYNEPTNGIWYAGTNDADNATVSDIYCTDQKYANNAVINDSRCADNEIINDNICTGSNDTDNTTISDTLCENIGDCVKVSISDKRVTGVNETNDSYTDPRTCKLCNMVVKKYSASERCHVAKYHLKDYGADWLYQCVACDYRMLSIHALQMHLKCSCPMGKIACVRRENYLVNKQGLAQLSEICRLAFPSVQFRFGINNNRRYACRFCGKQVAFYLKKRHAKMHMNEATGVSWLYKCLVCKKYKKFGLEAMRYHLKKFHNVPNFRKDIEFAENAEGKDAIEPTLAIAFPNV